MLGHKAIPLFRKPLLHQQFGCSHASPEYFRKHDGNFSPLCIFLIPPFPFLIHAVIKPHVLRNLVVLFRVEKDASMSCRLVLKNPLS